MNINIMKKNKSNKGFSYIEILISLGLLSIAIVPMTMAFFHISRTQVITYYTYQKAILLDSIMIQTVDFISRRQPQDFAQADLYYIIDRSQIDFKIETFDYYLVDFVINPFNTVSTDYEDYYLNQLFFIEIRIESQFGSASVFRYSLFRYQSVTIDT